MLCIFELRAFVLAVVFATVFLCFLFVNFDRIYFVQS